MKIFTLNTWLLPPPLAKDNRERVRNIIQMIERVDPDVVCLQEVWLRAYVRQIKSALSAYSFRTTTDQFLFNRSGLLVGSRKPITNYRADTFPDSKEHNLEEKIAGKGWQLASISGYTVLHTHLYASKDKDYRMTKAQLQQLEALTTPEDTILVGDLNLSREAFCESVQTFVCPEETEHTIVPDNPYASARLNAPSDAKWSYITPKKGSDLTINTEIIKELVVSDHFALAGKAEKL